MKALAEVTIRRMGIADLQAVVELDKLSFSDPWSLFSWQEMLDSSQTYLWVAEREKQIAGVLSGWSVLDELHIGTIAIHPEYRQQGIGTKLLETGLRESIALGVQLVHLEVRKSNLAAQRLYQRFGFEIVGERKKYYPNDHEDAILMSVYRLGEEYLHWLDGGRSPGLEKQHPT
jgi:[ribosomal protein S18]-alanine N-acetyltransferase